LEYRFTVFLPTPSLFTPQDITNLLDVSKLIVSNQVYSKMERSCEERDLIDLPLDLGSNPISLLSQTSPIGCYCLETYTSVSSPKSLFKERCEEEKLT